jgi:hypothetical protein
VTKSENIRESKREPKSLHGVRQTDADADDEVGECQTPPMRPYVCDAYFPLRLCRTMLDNRVVISILKPKKDVGAEAIKKAEVSTSYSQPCASRFVSLTR